MVYTVSDYKPIDNKVVEEQLEAVYNKDEKRLIDFVAAELMPRDKDNKDLIGPSYDGTLYLNKECLKFLLEKNGEERRKIGNNLNSKHGIDIDRILLEYDLGNNIDYKTTIAGNFHDLIEEDRATISQIRGFLEDTINSMDVDSLAKTKYRQGIDEIATILNSLTDPFYKQLQRVGNVTNRIPVFSYKEDKDIRELVDLIKTEKKDLDLSIKLNSICKRIKKKSEEDSAYFYKHTGIKNVIDIMEETKKDYMEYLHFNIYSPDLTKIKKEVADKIIKIKVVDRNSQNYETIEFPPSNGFGEKKFIEKHNIIKDIGQDDLDTLKDYIDGSKKSEEGYKNFIQSNKKLKKIIERYKSPQKFIEYYNSLEDLKIRGPSILKEIFKDFLNLDFCCKYINSTEYDPTLVNLKNLLVTSTLNVVIKPRKEHLVDYYHIKKKIAKKISKNVDEYKFIYKLTNSNSPNDIILRYYTPAMEGYYEMLETLDRGKRKQYRHLELWRHIFEKYEEDIRANDFGELRHKNLFIFDWGKFLDKYFNSENGRRIEKLFWKKKEELVID